MIVPTSLRRLLAMRPPEQDDGQGLVEYAMIIMLVALVVVSMLSAFGGSLGVLYEYINDQLPF